METLSRGATAAATRVEAVASALSPEAVLAVYAALIIAALGGAATALIAETPELRLLGVAVAIVCPVVFIALDWRAP